MGERYDETAGRRGAGDHAVYLGGRWAGTIHLYPPPDAGQPGLGPAGGSHRHEPAGREGVSLLREAGAEQLDRLYGSSFTGMVASLYDGRAIGEDDLAELRRYLDELEGK